MRMAIAALAAAAVVGLAFAADAAPTNKKKQGGYAAAKENKQRARTHEGQRFGYGASPEHYRTGTSEWWRAMEREGRGGFGDTP